MLILLNRLLVGGIVRIFVFLNADILVGFDLKYLGDHFDLNCFDGVDCVYVSCSLFLPFFADEI